MRRNTKPIDPPIIAPSDRGLKPDAVVKERKKLNKVSENERLGQKEKEKDEENENKNENENENENENKNKS